VPSIQLVSDESRDYYHAPLHYFADDDETMRRFCCLFVGSLREPSASPSPSTSASVSLW